MDTTQAHDLKAYYNGQRRKIEIYDSYTNNLVPLHGMGGGKSAFLACSGPSLKTLDLSLLNNRGIVVMGINNSPATLFEAGVMPNYWCGVDTPSHWIEQIWKEPQLIKFTPLGWSANKIKVRDLNGNLVDSKFMVRDCPAVFFFRREERFVVSDFLLQPHFCWGNEKTHTDELGIKGSRSIMLVAIKMLWYLGFSTVYLIGADFKMQEGDDVQNYAFPQARTPDSVRGNNATYAALNKRFDALRPYFNTAGFTVYNCNADSGLKSFAFIDYETAIARASREVTEKPINTLGHYELK